MFDGADNTRFYYLEVVGVSFDEIDGSEFAIAHRLLMVPGVISADADMETDLHSWQGEATESEAAFAAIKSLCFVDEDEVNVPKHKGWALVSTKVDTAWKEFGVTGLGVKLAQIDTGLAEHVEFDGRAIDNSLGINIYKPGRGAECYHQPRRIRQCLDNSAGRDFRRGARRGLSTNSRDQICHPDKTV